MSIAERGGGDDDSFTHDSHDDDDYHDYHYYDDDYYRSGPYYRRRARGGDGSFPLIAAIPAYFIVFSILSVFIVGFVVLAITGWQETNPLYEYHAAPWQVRQTSPQVLLSNNYWFEKLHLYQTDQITLYYEISDNTSRLELLVLTEQQFVNWNASKPYTPSFDVILQGTPQNMTIRPLAADQLYYLVLYNAPSLNAGAPVTIVTIEAKSTVKSSTITGYTTIAHKGALSSVHVPLSFEMYLVLFFGTTIGLTALAVRASRKKSKNEKAALAKPRSTRSTATRMTVPARVCDVCMTPATDPQQKFCQQCGNILS